MCLYNKKKKVPFNGGTWVTESVRQNRKIVKMEVPSHDAPSVMKPVEVPVALLQEHREHIGLACAARTQGI